MCIRHAQLLKKTKFLYFSTRDYKEPGCRERDYKEQGCKPYREHMVQDHRVPDYMAIDLQQSRYYNKARVALVAAEPVCFEKEFLPSC